MNIFERRPGARPDQPQTRAFAVADLERFSANVLQPVNRADAAELILAAAAHGARPAGSPSVLLQSAAPCTEFTHAIAVASVKERLLFVL